MILRDKTFLGDAASFSHRQRGERGLASLVNLQGVINASTTLHYVPEQCELSSRNSELMTPGLYMSNVKLAFHALVLFV